MFVISQYHSIQTDYDHVCNFTNTISHNSYSQNTIMFVISHTQYHTIHIEYHVCDFTKAISYNTNKLP